MDQNREDIIALQYCIDEKYLPLLFVVYLPFRINTESLIKNKLYICKEYNIQFSEINKLPYYEYETILEEINVIQKKYEKENENNSNMMNDMRPDKYAKSMTNSMSNFKMPTVKIPKL